VLAELKYHGLLLLAIELIDHFLNLGVIVQGAATKQDIGPAVGAKLCHGT
jgi:hypothetical protein